MESLSDRALSTYREEGALVTGKKALRRLYHKLYYRAISHLGHYSLTLDGRTVEFSAPTPVMVQRNQKRFQEEHKELSAFLDVIESEDTVYDIGANSGLYSLFASTKCHRGLVAAFEPYPPNIEILRRDRARNGFENIKIVESALSDTVGTIDFRQPENDDFGYVSSSIDATGNDDAIAVPTTTGDQLVADEELPQPNVVKIDVEGAEPLVIEGMKKTLSEPECRALFCEIHLSDVDKRPSIEDFGSSFEHIHSQLEKYGFEIENINTENKSEITIRAVK